MSNQRAMSPVSPSFIDFFCTTRYQSADRDVPASSYHTAHAAAGSWLLRAGGGACPPAGLPGCARLPRAGDCTLSLYRIGLPRLDPAAEA